MTSATTTFFNARDPHGDAKVSILRSYLGAWFAIFGQNKFADYKDLIVVDMFSGEGMYNDDIKGSPLVAIDIFLETVQRMSKIKVVHFFFADGDKSRCEKLKNALKPYYESDFFQGSGRPTHCPCFTIHVYHQQFENDNVITDCLKNNLKCPSFTLIDPFGYKAVPMAKVVQFLIGDRSEVLINLNMSGLMRALTPTISTSSIDIAARNSMQQAVSNLFGTNAWSDVPKLTDPSVRRHAVVDIYKTSLKQGGAKYVVEFGMRNPRNHFVYYLVFATKHPTGSMAMKNAMLTMSKSRDQDAMAFSSFDAIKCRLGDNAWLESCSREVISRFSGKGEIKFSEIKTYLFSTAWPFKVREIGKHLRRLGYNVSKLQETGVVTFPSKLIVLEPYVNEAGWNDAEEGLSGVEQEQPCDRIVIQPSPNEPSAGTGSNSPEPDENGDEPVEPASRSDTIASSAVY